jgi:serine protease DegS
MKEWFDIIFRSVFVGLVVAILLLVSFPQLGGRDLFNRVVEDFRGSRYKASYADAVEKAGPTVVSIYTQGINPSTGAQVNGQGSGVIIDSDGHVVTNHHVVKGMESFTVIYRDGLPRDAKLIGVDAITDLAVLKTNLINVPSAKLALDDPVRVGDVVLAIGNPRVGQSVSMGIVSAKGRVFSKGSNINNSYEMFIQTDAAINHGNSGGGLFNVDGELIGINSSFFSEESSGIGFALPVSLVDFVSSKIIKDGQVIRGWLGVSSNTISPYDLETLGIEDKGGIRVTGITKSSPAEQAGLRVGDVIVSINGKNIGELAIFVQWLSRMEPGTDIMMDVLRVDQQGKKQQLHIPVKLVVKPES